MSKPEAKVNTPYQGTRRCFGAFHCSQCNRDWYSGNSWANFGQQCQLCLGYVFPHAQWPLKKRKKSKTNSKAHPVDLCGKCKAIGRNCRKKLAEKM